MLSTLCSQQLLSILSEERITLLYISIVSDNYYIIIIKFSWAWGTLHRDKKKHVIDTAVWWSHGSYTSCWVQSFPSHNCKSLHELSQINMFCYDIWLQADKVKKANVLKLNHPKNPGYFFQLPSTYDFEKWVQTMWQWQRLHNNAILYLPVYILILLPKVVFHSEGTLTFSC